LTQFNRSASLNIGTAGKPGIKVSGLRINFDIKKKNNSETNDGIVNVYNLSENTREQLDKNLESGEKPKLFLNAGYTQAGGEKLLFVGDVMRISHKRSGPDYITQIIAQDGARDLNEVKVSLSFPQDASAKTILETILKAFPIKNDLKNLVIQDVILRNGFSFGGLGRTGLKKMMDYLNLDFSIQNDEIRIIPLDGNNKTTAILLTPETGLIDSPERINDRTEKATGKSKKLNPGWRLVSLLQPNIIPGGVVASKSLAIPVKTFFTVVSVDHRGDTHVGEFQTITDVKDAA